MPGRGFFCWTVQQLGHRAVALQPNLRNGSSIDFAAFTRLFGIAHSAQLILPQKPIGRDEALPPGARFDLVTGFGITFNRNLVADVRRFWSADDYLFLLDDLRTNFLRPDGQVVLRFNETLSGAPRRRHAPPAVVAYYRALGSLLAPFIVADDPEVGVTLDLFRPGAKAIVLPEPPQDDLGLDKLVANQRRQRERKREKRRSRAAKGVSTL